MENVYKILSNSDIPDNYKYYWKYQYELGKQFIVPYSQKIACFKKGDSVFEVGSAEGGVLAAFVEAGGIKAVGSDIAINRLEMGEKIADLLELPIKFGYHNIITEKIPEEWNEQFNLVLLRDVIEHLEDTAIALKNTSQIIKPGGFLFVSFPPYYSAFGGHQHTLGNKIGKLPFIHLLPDKFFYKLIASGREADIEEVKRLQSIKLTTKKFEKAMSETGFVVHKKEFYLLRPVYKMKFGLPAIKLTKLSFLPFVKNLISLEALYVLKKEVSN